VQVLLIFSKETVIRDFLQMKDTVMSATTHFGFKDVPEDAKEGMVHEVFASVATRYDLMNDAMSFGLHRAWKDSFIDQLRPRGDMKLLDVAGGTGDIAFRFLKSGGGHVTVCDINAHMLEEGKRRAIDQNFLHGMEWIEGNAEHLPFEDNHFDAYTIAFGIRNVTHIDAALAEAYRTLKTGGHFLCLEFTVPSNPILAKIYDAYSFHAIPRMGSMIAGDKASYQYLDESIRQFPKPTAFEAMIRRAGFKNVRHRIMTGGIVAIHSGWKL